jgi:hypothetical protein
MEHFINGIIDLHMHSSVSDGSDTPVELISCVKKAGIGLFSLTDHDAIKGSGIIREHLEKGGPAFISGVEFSCKDELGAYHILGYGYDPEVPGIREVVEKGHGFRMKKTKGRLEFLQEEFGFSFPEEELQELLARDNPGKPHIANMMVRHGYAKDKQEAIREYINKRRFKSEYVKPSEAIEGILRSGGIPVLAHPAYGSGDELILGEELEERVCKLMEMGLAGLEAFYSGFTEKIETQVLNLAEKHGLYVTAGSDYHGSNKMVDLGWTNLDTVPKWPPGLKRFLEEVEIIEA